VTEKTAEQEKDSESVDNKSEETTSATEAEDKQAPGSDAVSGVHETIDEQAADAADVSPAENPVDDAQTDSAEKADAPPVTETVEEPVKEVIDDSVIVAGSLSRALQKCRERADLTIEQAAGEMHLPLSVMRALENENFADLPEPPYVRGYLRSYARLSESDPNDLINRYETLRGADPRDASSYSAPVSRHQKAGSKKEVSPTTIKLAGFSMIVLMLVVLSMIPAVSQWATDTWNAFSEPQARQLAAKSGNDNGAADTDTNNSDNSGAADSAAETTLPATPDASSSNDTAGSGAADSEQLPLSEQADQEQNTAEAAEAAESETGADESATPAVAGDSSDSDATDEPADSAAATDMPEGNTEDPADDSQTAATDGDTDSAAQEAQSDDALTDTATQAGATEQDTADTDTAEQTAQTGTEESTEQAAAEQNTVTEQAEQTKKTEPEKQEDKFQQPFDGNVAIRLVFSQPVWMSIKDGRGKTIFGALNSAGTVKELQARTPLEFHVGNAPGVQIYLNGQLIDQRPHTRGSVARFRAN
jgi:cytoskeletal protein RodZ